MQEKKNVREKGALTLQHVSDRGHVPAANILVERTRIKEHCASPTHTTRNRKCTTKTEERGPVRVQNVFVWVRKEDDEDAARHDRTGAGGRRRGTRFLHMQSLRGSKQGKRTCERRGHLLCCISFTEDTSQLPISWSNTFLFESEPELNIERMVVTDDTSQLPMSWLNTLAAVNIKRMVVTDDTSQLPMNWLNVCAALNMFSMVATPAVCHEAMGPYVPCAAAVSEKNKSTAS